MKKLSINSKEGNILGLVVNLNNNAIEGKYQDEGWENSMNYKMIRDSLFT